MARYPSSEGAYQKRQRYLRSQGMQFKVPARSVNRRLEALACMGYSLSEVGRLLDLDKTTVAKWCTRTWHERGTYDAVSELYERLHMTLKTSPAAKRTRTIALKRGYAPPLAWDDIDTDERPKGMVAA